MQNSELKMARFPESTFGRQDAEGKLFFWRDRPILATAEAASGPPVRLGSRSVRNFRVGILDLAEESANTAKESTLSWEVEVEFGKGGITGLFDGMRW